MPDKMDSNNTESSSSEVSGLLLQISDLKEKFAKLETEFATLKRGNELALKEINEALATLEVYLNKVR